MKIIYTVLVISALVSCKKKDMVEDEVGSPIFYEGMFGISYPAVSSAKERNFSQNALHEIGVNNVRFSVHWNLIETSDDKFDWSGFDKKIQFVRENNLNLFLSVEAKAPNWECSSVQNDNSCVFKDNLEFRKFITELLKQYRNDIKYIQFGNEMISPNFYIGTINDFIAANNIFYETIKENAPEIIVVLGGFSTGTLRRYAACKGKVFPVYYQEEMLEGQALQDLCNSQWVTDDNNDIEDVLINANYDAIDLHFYDDAENWALLFEAVRDFLPNTPVYITEFGGPMVSCTDNNFENCILGPTEKQSNYSDTYHAERLRTYMEIIKALQVELALYFKLIESNDKSQMHTKSGLYKLIEGNTPERKPAIDVFTELR